MTQALVLSARALLFWMADKRGNGEGEMELKDFIARTLTEIAEGVRAAQEATKEFDTRINPFTGANPRSRKIIQIQFDVAISEGEGTATDGRIGVLAGIVGVASSGKSSRDSKAATSIKFSVPMVLPSESDEAKHPQVKKAAPLRSRSLR